jgi:hypothetical protein
MRGTRDYGFLTGLGAGAMAGAALTIWFAPRLRNDLAGAVARAANHVERVATAARTDCPPDAGVPSAPDRPHVPPAL